MLLQLPKPIEECDDAWRAWPNSTRQYPPLPDSGMIQVETAILLVDQEIVNLILEGVRERCFTPGALVVSKKVPKLGLGVPNNWGIITHLNQYAQKGTLYKPIVVQWLSGSRQEMNEEDLWLIQPPPSEKTIQGLIKCTGC